MGIANATSVLYRTWESLRARCLQAATQAAGQQCVRQSGVTMVKRLGRVYEAESLGQ